MTIDLYCYHQTLIGYGYILTDYVGIEGQAAYRGELVFMYFPTLERATGRLRELFLVPTRIQRFRVNHAGREDRDWLLAMLRRECRAFGSEVEARADGAFAVRWK